MRNYGDRHWHTDSNEKRDEKQKINLLGSNLQIKDDIPVYTTFIVVKESKGVLEQLKEVDFLVLGAGAGGAVVGCLAGAIVGAGVGCIPAAVVGFKAGFTIALIGSPVYVSTKKEIFVPSINVFSGGEIAKACTSLE